MHILWGKWKANNASENRQITEQWRVVTSALQGYHDNNNSNNNDSGDPKALAAQGDMLTMAKGETE